jgi:ABC-2 type transport system permease protein
MMKPRLSWHTVLQLAGKELRSLWRDRLLLVFVLWAFSGAIYTAATAMPDRLVRAPIAVVDEDQTVLSQRLISAFYPPDFLTPDLISLGKMDAGLDTGRYSFVLDIPPGFQRDVVAGRRPALQLNVDATQLRQSFVGTGYVQSMIQLELQEFVQGERAAAASPVELAVRMRFNPTLNSAWFTGVMEVINMVTMLSIILVLLPLQMLSGGATPRESMPEAVRTLMLLAPTTHFVSLAQAVLYRGAGLSIVWPTLLALTAIGATFFVAALTRFRRSLALG